MSDRPHGPAGMPSFAHVTGAEVIGDHCLRLTFDDGAVGTVDFSEREWRGVFEPLRDPAYFAQVSVDAQAGSVVWPNGADMSPETLYDAARKRRVIADDASPADGGRIEEFSGQTVVVVAGTCTRRFWDLRSRYWSSWRIPAELTITAGGLRLREGSGLIRELQWSNVSRLVVRRWFGGTTINIGRGLRPPWSAFQPAMPAEAIAALQRFAPDHVRLSQVATDRTT